MTKKDYLSNLIELQQFLKDHPEQIKVYSDLHIKQKICNLKYEIMEETRNNDDIIADEFITIENYPF